MDNEQIGRGCLAGLGSVGKFLLVMIVLPITVFIIAMIFF